MANIFSLQHLRNSTIYNDLAAAKAGLMAKETQDGVITLARYYVDSADESKGVKTIFGINYSSLGVTDPTKTAASYTIYDTDTEAIGALKDLVDTINGSDTVDGSFRNAVKNAIDTLKGGVSEDYDTLKKIEDKIKAANASSVANDNKVVSDVTQTDGKITATVKNITEVKLDGYTVGGDDSGKVGNTDTLGAALGKLQGQINGMDKEASSADGEVVITVVETDGKVTEEKSKLKDILLTGYNKSDDTGDIAATDTVNAALSKLENTVGANKITNADHSIVVTEPTSTATTTDVKVNINSEEKVIKLGDNGIYTDIKLSAITVSDTNVKEAWGLFTGTEQLGSTIKIYKDSAYKEIYLGTSADTIDTTSGEITKKEGDKQSLNYAYIKADGTYDLVRVDVSAFLSEKEFKDGLQVNNHEVSVKVDTSSEKVTIGEGVTGDVLTATTDGVKVSNIQNAINYAISTLDANVTGGTTAGTKTNGHVQVVVDEVDGKLTTVTVNETNIADADKLAELSGKTVTEVASSNDSITAALSAATDGTKHLDIITDASKIKMTGFTNANVITGITESSSVTDAFKKVDEVITENEETVSAALNDLEGRKAEKTDLDSKFSELDNKIKELSGGTSDDLAAEITARKAVDGIDGNSYTATSTANYISDASSLNDADQKLDAAIKKNALTVAPSSEGAIILNPTDTSTTIALGYLDAGTY